MVTIDDVRTYGRPAFLSLPTGAFLRYHPEDEMVRIISNPHKQDELDRLPVLHGDIPHEGWRHAPSCGCSRCRPDGCDVG